jgi:hypothetical protein
MQRRCKHVFAATNKRMNIRRLAAIYPTEPTVSYTSKSVQSAGGLYRVARLPE